MPTIEANIVRKGNGYYLNIPAALISTKVLDPSKPVKAEITQDLK